jgi:hypothetical protein
MAKPKTFKLAADQIKPLAEGFGACIATDEISVRGRKVGFMYRQAPDEEMDSGWRFMAGDESQDYMDEESNHTVFDVNTIANYDPDIIPFLLSRVGAAYEREDGSGKFIAVDFDVSDED